MRNQNGFTLVEIMVALVILAFGLSGLLTMSVYTLRLASDNDKWTVARVMAQSQIEQTSGEQQSVLITWPSYSTSVQTVHAESYTVEQWLTPLGTATDPLEITVRVKYSGFAAGVSVTTIKTFYM